MPLGPGDVLGRFEIVAAIGEGGMGAVYRARDPKLGRHVAIKVLAGIAHDAQARARFDREARVIAALDHPAAVHVFEASEADGVPFIVMELVDGVTLRVAAERESSWQVKLAWLLDVAAALASAHAAALVHRDIKPDNVMVRHDGRVKVLDFGIARRFDGASTDTAVTAEGTMIGTPLYMAPEQLRNESIDGRADQFSWGVTAYEVLSGALPWTDTRDGVRVIAQVLGSTPRSLCEILPELPPEVGALVARTLAKDPSARFPSMGDVMAAVAAVLGGAAERIVSPAFPLGPRDVSPTQSAPSARASPEAFAPTVAAPTPPSTKLPAQQARPRWVVPAAIAGLALAALVTVVALRPTASARAPEPTAPSAVASASTPVSAIPGAAAAYEEATESWRHDSRSAAIKGWEEALKLDPKLCAAHVRLGTILDESSFAPADHFDLAARCAARLDARDRALIEALTPAFAAPPDSRAAASRMRGLVDRWPADAELACLLGEMLEVAEPSSEEPLRDFDRALSLDPQLVLAYELKANYLLARGRGAEGTAVLEACSAAAPGATMCASQTYLALLDDGRCDRADRVVRQFIALRPTSSAGYSWLPAVLVARGAPSDAIAAAFEQYAERAGEPAGATSRLPVAVATGDFESALTLSDEAEQEGGSKLTREARQELAATRASILLEAGRVADARRAFEDYRRRSEAYLSRSTAEQMERVVARDLAFAAILNLAPARSFFESRARSVEREGAMSAGLRWVKIYTFMWMREAPEIAREAVSHLPNDVSFEALRAELAASHEEGGELGVGLTLALGGRPGEAIPWLRDGLRPCLTLENPLDLLRGHLELGSALEATGDKAGAREQYEDVLVHWGNAKPRSVTADRARARLVALQ